MDLQYHSIVKFQAIPQDGSLIIVGMGSDGWMYQYYGENGVWNRLSTKYPNQIMLATPPISEAPIEAPVEAPAPEPAPEAPAV